MQLYTSKASACLVAVKSKTDMELKSGNVQLRKLSDSDAEAITTLINNRNILDNLRDVIPYPYYLKDAKDFIRLSKINKKNHA